MYSIQTNSDFNYLLGDKTFMSLKSYKERVEYFVTKVKPISRLIDDFIQITNLYKSGHKKSRNYSQISRFEGHHNLRGQQFKRAKRCFTNAIVSAPFPQDCGPEERQELSECYADRSLVFFQMKLYNNALFDANQSIGFFETPEMVYNKINCLLFAKEFNQMNQFIDECLQRIDQKFVEEKGNLTKDKLKELKNTYKVTESGDQNNSEIEKSEDFTNLWIHSNVEIKNTKQKGRHLLAKDYISDNTLVIREKSLNMVFFGQNVYQFCNYCNRHLGDKFWPCPQCDEVVFCNQTCAQQAIHGIHGYECGITGLIFNMGPNVLQIFRIFVEFPHILDNFQIHKKSIDLKEYIDEESQLKCYQRNESQKSNRLGFISNLVQHSDKDNESEWISNTFTAIQTTILLNYTKVLDSKVIYDMNSFVSFATLVTTYLSRVSINSFSFLVDKEDRDSEPHAANCLFLFSSMINHSCDPNINWYIKDNYIFFKAIRDIKEGEEINITYGMDQSTPLIKRQIKLKEKYHFVCNCKACLQTLPTISSLKCLVCDGPVLYEKGVNINSCLHCGKEYEDIEDDIEEVDDLFKELKENIRDLPKDRVKCLESVQNIIEDIKELVFHSSYDLLKVIRQLIKVCLHFSDLQKAIDLSKHLLTSIESQTEISEQTIPLIFDDLFLLNEVFYRYLSEKQIEKTTNEYSKALNVFNLTIDLLEKVEESKTTEETEDSNSMLCKCVENFKHKLREFQ